MTKEQQARAVEHALAGESFCTVGAHWTETWDPWTAKGTTRAAQLARGSNAAKWTWCMTCWAAAIIRPDTWDEWIPRRRAEIRAAK